MGTLTDTLAGRAKQVAGRATGNRRLARRGRSQVRRAKVRRVLGRKATARPTSARRPARVLALAPLARPVKVVRRTVTVEVYRPGVDDLEDEPSDRR